MTILDMRDRALAREAARAEALARHPAMQPFEGVSSKAAAALRAIASHWDDLRGVLDRTDEPLADDEAELVLQPMIRALTHPLARGSLVFHLPELLDLHRQLAQMTSGASDPQDHDHCSRAEAVDRLQEQIDLKLWVLLTGTPATDACRTCTRTRPLTGWHTRLGCTTHRTQP